VSDLELGQGARNGQLEDLEKPVAEVMDDVLEEGPVLLTRVQGHIAAERKKNAGRFSNFQSRISKEIRDRKWYVPGSGGKIMGWSVPGFFVAGIVLLVVGAVRFESAAPAWSDVLMIVFGLACFPNALVLLVAVFNVRLWRKRTKHTQLEAERWAAFRRYLTDFPRLEEAPPATLALWERYLVYGISFGIAGKVLEAAHLHMPQELHDQSSIYWISANGSPGSGASALGIEKLVGGFASAFTPPASPSSSSSSFSSSSGFGGSFSGGSGGGGGGGGGGGAW
jgi:uncharacterized membrane protein